MDEKKRLGTPLNGNVHALKIRNMMINAIVYVRIGWVGQCEGLSVAGRDKGCMADEISQTRLRQLNVSSGRQVGPESFRCRKEMISAESD